MYKIMGYLLPRGDPVELYLPQGAVILCVQMSSGSIPHIFARVDEERPPVRRVLRVFETGREMGSNAPMLMYIGTVAVTVDRTSYHVFEEIHAKDLGDLVGEGTVAVEVMTQPLRAARG